MSVVLNTLVINGTPTADVIDATGANGTTSQFVIDAGGGADLVFGGEWNDTINGGGGADAIFGGGGKDFIYGGAGADSLDGDDVQSGIGGFVRNFIVADEGTNPFADILV